MSEHEWMDDLEFDHDRRGRLTGMSFTISVAKLVAGRTFTVPCPRCGLPMEFTYIEGKVSTCPTCGATAQWRDAAPTTTRRTT